SCRSTAVAGSSARVPTPPMPASRLRVVRFARAARVAFCCLAGWLLSPQAQAQYELEEEQPFWIRALLDVRLVRGGSAASWTDGGPGKTRYGGRATASGFERETRLALAQLAIEASATLPWDLRAQAQVNVQPDIADGYEPWLIEAVLRKEWTREEQGWGTQAGVMNVPFSLEHVGPAWSPEYALSASALGSWLWEDINLAGAEAEWWRVMRGGLKLGVLVGAGFGADRSARLLALRGWAIGDGVSGVNGDLPLPGGVTRSDVFHERDDRPAVYTWLTLGDASDRATLKAGWFDNGGDQQEPGVWDTRFGTLAGILHPHAQVDLLVQYLRGEARVREPSNDSALRALHALISWHDARHRVSVRYDEFRVRDLDGGPRTDERGDGITVAWLVGIGLRHRVGFEHVWLDSRRPASALPQLSHDGWQLSYRFRY
ncbi:MAG TPA: hypothetical protein VJ011_02785, partial [Steroidobacteraceae bacterium]|nr:hypothetical protein [Steroidobacteraceae bacterium]